MSSSTYKLRPLSQTQNSMDHPKKDDVIKVDIDTMAMEVHDLTRSDTIASHGGDMLESEHEKKQQISQTPKKICKFWTQVWTSFYKHGQIFHGQALQ